jgi:hypothetical protein
MPLQAFQIDADIVLEFDANGVIATARFDDCDLVVRANDSFGEQEARGKVFIVARRSHRDRHAARLPLAAGFIAETNLQRLLYGNPVVQRFAQITAKLFNFN